MMVMLRPRLGKVRPPKPIADSSTMTAWAEHANLCFRRRELVSSASEAC